MSCDSGLSEVEDDEDYFIEITGYGPVNQLFVWRVELDWEWSYCTGGMGIFDHTIDYYEPDSYSVSTHTWWSYEGNVSSTEDVDQNASSPTVTIYRQDLYDGDNIFGYPMGAANPYAELLGDGYGNSEILDWSSDT